VSTMDWESLWDQPQDTVPSNVVNLPIVNNNGTDHNYALAALRGEAAEVANATKGHRNDALNRAYFNMGRHILAGTISKDTVITALADAARRTGLPESEIQTTLRDDSTSGLAKAAAKVGPRHPPPLPELPTVHVIEEPDQEVLDYFWTSRDLITHLHDFARARRVSPWAVLGVTLARIIARTPHQVCLPPIVGGRASLNLFVGLVGPSGSGKGGAEAAAADALHVGHIETHTTGSGEGIAHGFRKREKGEILWRDHEHAVLFSVAEIDTLAAQGDRKGATLMPELRRAWSGEQLGFGYADPTKRLPVPAHEYRMALVAGIQPTRAGALLNDSDGGTPQRFLWMPAIDPTAPDNPPDEPPPRTWNPPSTSGIVAVGGARIDVCQTAKDTIIAARLARLRGQDGEALDGHALLARLKVAAALGIADGRYNVNDQDWALAGIVINKSDAVRTHIAAILANQIAAANNARAEAEATRAVHVTQRLEDEAVKRVCNVIIRKLKAADDPMAGAPLRRAVAGRDRKLFDEAVERLEKAGQIATENDGRGVHYRLKEEES
jgi:hypothetical protein